MYGCRDHGGSQRYRDEGVEAEWTIGGEDCENSSADCQRVVATRLGATLPVVVSLLMAWHLSTWKLWSDQTLYRGKMLKTEGRRAEKGFNRATVDRPTFLSQCFLRNSPLLGRFRGGVA